MEVIKWHSEKPEVIVQWGRLKRNMVCLLELFVIKTDVIQELISLLELLEKKIRKTKANSKREGIVCRLSENCMR